MSEEGRVPPTIGSLFAGVGGFDLGFERAGFRTVWQCEIDKAAQSVLRRRFPGAALYSDVREVGAANLEPVDVLTYGSPCQNLSVAGKRAGLAGAQSGLFFEAARVIRELRDRYGKPDFAIWENVPGAFSSNEGRDFAAVVQTMVDLGARDVCWRVLDSQNFGVAQRRRRVFLVADFAGERAEQVLFEPESLRGDIAPSGKKRKGAASGIAAGAGGGGGAGGGWPADVASTLDTHYGDKQGLEDQHVNSGCPNFVPAAPIPFDTTQITSALNYSRPEAGDPCHPLAAGAHPPAVAMGYAVHGERSWAMLSPNPDTLVARPTEVARCLDSTGGYATNQGGTIVGAVAFAQNTRDEVRLVNGDGQLVGALAAQPGMKQTSYVAIPIISDPISSTDVSHAVVMPAMAFASLQGGRSMPVTPECPTLEAGNGNKVPSVMISPAAIGFNWQNGGGYGNANDGLGITNEGTGPLQRSQTPAVCVTGERTHALTSEGHDASEDGTGRGCPVVATGVAELWPSVGAVCARDYKGVGTQYVNEGKVIPVMPATVRRLVPQETEILQGFPPGWTAEGIDLNGKVKAQADGPRYKQMGNAVTVNVAEWIARRVAAVMNVANATKETTDE